MADWEWYSYDLATGDPLGRLTFTEWSSVDLLNDAGEWSGTLDLSGRSRQVDVINATTPARSLIVARRDGQTVGHGIVWRRNRVDGMIAGAGLLSYFDRRYIRSTFTKTNLDQHTLARNLIATAQAAGGGNIQIDTSTDTVLAGVTRTRTWQPQDDKNLGGALRDLSGVIDGPDFDIRVEQDGVRRLRLWSPRRGQQTRASSPRFVLGVNALDIAGVDEDGVEFATSVTAFGEEINATTRERLTATATNADQIAAGYPLLDTTLDKSDVREQTTLNAAATGTVRRVGQMTSVLTVTVDPDYRGFPWGSWDLGDNCRIIIPPGIEPGLPTGLNEVRRIVEHRWSVGSDGEQLNIVAGSPSIR